MCGLVGVLGDISGGEGGSKRFEDLLDVCQLRGRDATGVIAVSQQNKYAYAKAVGSPSFLKDTHQYSDMMTGWKSALIGHCRAKTIGDNSRKNAHPFDFPEQGIIGVHNGTLRNHMQLPEHKVGMVDSEVLYANLANNGPSHTFSKIIGAYACVWWDANNNTVNFIRNDERPLFFAWSADFKTMWWASETWMFSAVERKVKLFQGDPEKDTPKFVPLPVNTLWSFTVTPNDKTKVHFTETKVEPAKEVRANSGNSVTLLGFSGHNRGGEAPDPFRMTHELDDPLPGEETGGNTRDGKQSTAKVSQQSTTYVPKSTATPTGTTCTQKSSTTTTCLSHKSSKVSELPARKKLTVVSNTQCTNSEPQQEIEHRTAHVDIRTVAGLQYITDRSTGTEYYLEDFERNTSGCCSFCEKPIGDLTEVYRFFNKNTFICTSCLTPPKAVN